MLNFLQIEDLQQPGVEQMYWQLFFCFFFPSSICLLHVHISHFWQFLWYFNFFIIIVLIIVICNVGDLGSIPGSRRSPGGGNGSLLQYSCLENSMDRKSGGLQCMGWQRVEQDWETNTFTFMVICDQWSEILILQKGFLHILVAKRLWLAKMSVDF